MCCDRSDWQFYKFLVNQLFGRRWCWCFQRFTTTIVSNLQEKERILFIFFFSFMWKKKQKVNKQKHHPTGSSQKLDYLFFEFRIPSWLNEMKILWCTTHIAFAMNTIPNRCRCDDEIVVILLHFLVYVLTECFFLSFTLLSFCGWQVLFIGWRARIFSKY